MANENDMVGTEVLKFDLAEEFSVETALVVCEIYKNGADWKFNAVGAGYTPAFNTVSQHDHRLYFA